MTIRRRALGALAAAGSLALPRLAHAAWPADKPIEVIVPYPPGGGVDTMARMVLPAVQAKLQGARFVVVNRAGAGGQLGWEAAFAAAPDGYTLAATSVPALVTYPIERQVRYRPLDFTFIANVVDDPGGLFVRADSPLRTLADLIAAAKARPGQLSYGSTGIGSDDHLLVIALEDRAGMPPMTHVPFNGMAPLGTALAGGHIDVGAFNMSESLALLQAGRIRSLGQAALTRWSGTPDVPTFAEQGQNLVSGATRGIVGPPGLPAEIAARLEAAFREAMAEPAFVAEANRMGLPLAPRIGADFRSDVVGLERDLRGLWQRRPWRES
ncbi:tripartite tricarboxylate transporter substrate binding protein [Roseomonas alkaliterrae]|uniref:Tripartite-type tricarboxylate transporter receptor subunit TctC n=1 Tax=Neoroseomonas alkaliterrae TaxID=1452450 RepID=A0A840XXQ3_9PROT|nr:tripartite tricarboxylate transporter substrate binding protein [Neoroseomonas alkaliterrae]MBB5688947.1 tripartite-type tricarboxylate transporter receptor subunit TctC [Neoroseomonas alkaliterrae]MBR0674822.1 tripartite tricarboxylate transporter substrate binding protein [Neoroseomonas alkaliterrae]